MKNDLRVEFEDHTGFLIANILVGAILLGVWIRSLF
jgi:hypothetical protein